MSLRLVHVSTPATLVGEILESSRAEQAVASWSTPIDADRALVSLVVEAEQCEGIVDRLGERFPSVDLRIVMVPVEAAYPAAPTSDDSAGAASEEPKRNRISRDELLLDLEDGFQPKARYFVTVLLSSIVAAIGLARDDLAIIIGAMVIAPLLTPNVALALGTTLGDPKMVRRALLTNAYGFTLALAFSWVVGATVDVDVAVAAIQSRTVVSFGDLALALAAGTAGALAFTSGLPASLVGVMVAVALLPPTIVTGLLLGVGETQSAYGSGLLLATNVICVNLSGVLTFWSQGLRPRTWWQAEKASRATWIAVLLWGALLLTLATLIAISG